MASFRKSGITPLMSTFLLVSFAVAVSVVVINFGRAEVTEGAVCPLEVGLHWAEISGMTQICADGQGVSFVVENGIAAEVQGFLVNVIGSRQAQTFDLSETVPLGGSYVGKVAFDVSSNGAIRQVKIVPKIVLKGTQEICPDQALVVEILRACV